MNTPFKFCIISLEMVILGTVPDLSIVDAIAIGLAGKQLYLRFSFDFLELFLYQKIHFYIETTTKHSRHFKRIHEYLIHS